jgi:hypothetical protein
MFTDILTMTIMINMTVTVKTIISVTVRNVALSNKCP